VVLISHRLHPFHRLCEHSQTNAINPAAKSDASMIHHPVKQPPSGNMKLSL